MNRQRGSRKRKFNKELRVLKDSLGRRRLMCPNIIKRFQAYILKSGVEGGKPFYHSLSSKDRRELREWLVKHRPDILKRYEDN